VASLRALLLLIIAGAVWGGIALGLGSRAFGPGIWAGVLLSPLIGLAIGVVTQAAFERYTGLRRWLVALASLYLGGTLFGLVVGIAEAWRHGLEWPRLAEGIRLTHAFLAWENER
jgi:hypothetical protein